MIYLINQRVIFNEGDGTLARRTQENEVTSLSAPLARILATLIENPDVTLSRESLLRETLEKHALSPSMNNLNNYISLLRKVLREFELDDAIVTIPKTGIAFSVSSIEVYKAHTVNEPPEDAGFVDVNVDVGRPTDVQPVCAIQPVRVATVIKESHTLKITLVASAILVFSLIAVAFPSRFPSRPLVKINIPEKCSLYALKRINTHDALPAYEELCSDNMLFLASKKHLSRRTLIAKPGVLIACTKQGKGCVTYVDY